MTWKYKRIIIEAVVVCCLGAVVGLSVNHRMVIDAFTGKLASKPAPPSDSASVAEYPVPTFLEEVLAEREGGALLVDARVAELYREGHIAGAVSLPLADCEARLEQFKKDIDPDRTLIVYCSGYGCPDSFDLGQILLEEGFRDVRVYEGGMPEWRDQGLPVEKGAP
ncbi:MAG: rhodanese-like domain-containing protein [Geoalkalibacter sp.]|uniref:rhodanese-like domain-containing protein n=1 Tax=Geoalkalibacter sp. TaxID=3041440 RepID=UPI003D13F447